MLEMRDVPPDYIWDEITIISTRLFDVARLTLIAIGITTIFD